MKGGKGQGEHLLENGLCLLDVSLVVRKHLLKFLVEVDELFKQKRQIVVGWVGGLASLFQRVAYIVTVDFIHEALLEGSLEDINTSGL